MATQEKKRARWVLGGLWGGLTTALLVLFHYIASTLAGLPRPAFVVFDAMVRLLPGNVITLVIDTMVKAIRGLNLGPTSQVAKLIEQSMAILSFIAAGVLLGIILTLLGRRRQLRLPRMGVIGGLIVLVPVVAIMFWLGFPAAGPIISLLFELLVFAGWGWVLGKLIEFTSVESVPETTSTERRRFLSLVGVGSFTILVAAAGVRLLTEQKNQTVVGTGASQGNEPATSGAADTPPQATLEARIQPAPGTRDEITSNSQFYRIDIDAMPPTIDESTWHLKIDGLVDNPLELSLDDIRQFPAYTQAITLECISNPLGGDLTSTSLWTGARFKDVLANAGLQDGVQEIHIEAQDGFYESVPLEEAMDDRTLLVYAMNGGPLPQPHGFPLRIYIPNHFGMKQPKWITHMQAVDQKIPGYWVDRGWSDTAIPPTTSVIDVVDKDSPDPASGAIPVGGIAYAGARGISRVEVQVDDGPWQPAELRDPPYSPLTWVQWRFDWTAAQGEHTFSVRAYDGNGDLQITEESPAHPNGATGIFQKTETITSQSG